MPRHARLHLSDVPVHALQRGNDRRACFRDDDDRKHYLWLLTAETRFCRVAVHAYVLMTNHIHLLMTPVEPDGIALVMQRVHQRYAQYFNARHRRVGTLWQGRYKSCLVDTDGYLLVCQRYIECNPVRARMVAHPAAYAWSSYRANALGERDPLVTAHPASEALDPHPGAWRPVYRAFVEADPGIEAAREIRAATEGGFVLGGPALLQRVSEEFGHPGVRQRPGRRVGQKINVV